MLAPPRHNRRAVPGAMRFDKTNPFIYVGDLEGVRKQRARPGALLAPIDIDPNLFRWPVDGLAVVVVSMLDARSIAQRLAQALVADGAVLVACVCEEADTIFFRRGDLHEG